MKVMIVVTHLLGTGHLTRALTLGRAFVAAGDTVVLVSGGVPVAHLDFDGIDLVQLPPLKSDGVDFSRMLTPDGTVADAIYLQTRRQALLDAFAGLRPDLLITELFPFGRRILRHEFTALLQAAQALEVPVLSSIRDILAPPSKPAKAALAEDLITTYYSGVLVHSVAGIAALDISWPVSENMQKCLYYTGFVAPAAPEPHPDGTGTGEVLVSAGGGSVGDNLFDAALAAAALDKGRKWRVLVGGSADRVAALRSRAPEHCTVDAARPDFRQMLCGAAVSVSMCGYNTALDVLQTGVRAVFVPFDAGDEVEQGLRADALAVQPGIAVLRAADLTAQRLLDSVNATLAAAPRAPLTEGVDGAAETVRVAHRILGEHHAG
ncbi:MULTISPECIES: glycosyltransferase family protein [Roseobacteraceae]|uniref:UDP-N-acetylglucosamine--N-acetylmuramyl-(Pentapeptide) pyrophosphoryl-undecaprenol N-acetylglucosamine transferase n=1 Tax=Pseudosulfitobacter pseudonitzschiae TaxID=1402135 RepID=A0A221JWG4_9RHOB|nr:MULTISPECIES: glycosyltransferase [Roseobacteraceae]ASM71074.1 UDP-N-acetylglucosamine--N-acetylmuramyl- (pentapeptide) pyrophosphoryl-undecaprenol N-acetylglucosamine transferase [Pseudosulfitobacter pseudonitzschiae]